VEPHETSCFGDRVTTESTQGDIVGLLHDDPDIGSLVHDLHPDPSDQRRLFRGRLVEGDGSCVLKIGLGELEAVWMPAVSSRSDDIVAHVIGSGTLSATDEDWLLLEDLPVLALTPRANDCIGVMRCAARFQQVARDLDLPTYPIDAEFVRTHTHQAIDADCPGPASEILPRIEADDRWLRSLGGHTTGHGDVHFWNAVAATADGPWRLIDPIPRTAHWAWDAAYAQLTSGVPETPDLLTILAEERRRIGLPVEDGEQLQSVRVLLLGWSSVLWWALLHGRREDLWWREQVEFHVTALATLEL
jgi:hypothetical protein